MEVDNPTLLISTHSQDIELLMYERMADAESEVNGSCDALYRDYEEKLHRQHRPSRMEKQLKAQSNVDCVSRDLFGNTKQQANQPAAPSIRTKPPSAPLKPFLFTWNSPNGVIELEFPGKKNGSVTAATTIEPTNAPLQRPMVRPDQRVTSITVPCHSIASDDAMRQDEQLPEGAFQNDDERGNNDFGGGDFGGDDFVQPRALVEPSDVPRPAAVVDNLTRVRSQSFARRCDAIAANDAYGIGKECFKIRGKWGFWRRAGDTATNASNATPSDAGHISHGANDSVALNTSGTFAVSPQSRTLNTEPEHSRASHSNSTKTQTTPGDNNSSTAGRTAGRGGNLDLRTVRLPITPCILAGSGVALASAAAALGSSLTTHGGRPAAARALTFMSSRSPNNPSGIINDANICFAIALFQAFACMTAFVSSCAAYQTRRCISITYRLANIVNLLHKRADSREISQRIKDLLHNSRLQPYLRLGRQNDVDELFALLYHFVSTEGPSNLFSKVGATVLSTRVCQGCGSSKNIESIEEPRVKLPVPEDGTSTLESLIEAMGQPEEISVRCESEGCPEQISTQRISIMEVKRALPIQLARYSYDNYDNTTTPIRTPVQVPENFVLQLSEGYSALLRLVAIVTHEGSTSSSGHFICYGLRSNAEGHGM